MNKRIDYSIILLEGVVVGTGAGLFVQTINSTPWFFGTILGVIVTLVQIILFELNT